MNEEMAAGQNSSETTSNTLYIAVIGLASKAPRVPEISGFPKI